MYYFNKFVAFFIWIAEIFWYIVEFDVIHCSCPVNPYGFYDGRSSPICDTSDVEVVPEIAGHGNLTIEQVLQEYYNAWSQLHDKGQE